MQNKADCTWKITEWQICNIGAADLKRYAVMGEAQLSLFNGHVLVVIQEILDRFRWVQNSALSAADAIFNLILVVNWRSEIFIAGLTKGCATGIGWETKWHSALPLCVRVRQATLCWTPGGTSVSGPVATGFTRTYRVQVPAARGSVIPEIDSMREDFPALWDPITAICGRSISTCTLSNVQHRQSAVWYENMNGHFTPWSEGGSQGQAFYVRFETFVGWTVRPQHWYMLHHPKVLLAAFDEMQSDNCHRSAEAFIILTHMIGWTSIIVDILFFERGNHSWFQVSTTTTKKCLNIESDAN